MSESLRVRAFSRPLRFCLNLTLAGIGSLTAADYYIDPAGNETRTPAPARRGSRSGPTAPARSH